jgi:hypothetical protein
MTQASNDLKWMISSDQQFPYQDDKMIELWFKVMKWFKPDVVDYLGDTDDQACYSKYTEGRSAEFLKMHKDENGNQIVPLMQHEAKLARDFYTKTRKVAGKDAQLFSALGNHDIRVFDYLDAKLPNYVNLVTPETLWGLDSLGYEYIYYNELPKLRFGDMHVHHGLAIAQNAGESVKKDIDNFGVSLMRGHSHRAGVMYQTYELRNDGKGEILRGYELGHMCDEKGLGMKYTTTHNWQKAFAIAHIVNDYPHIQLVHVTQDYTCVVDGKKFSV